MDNRRFSVEDPTSSSRVRRDVRCHTFSSVIQHSFFKTFILMIIIINAFVIALEEEYNNAGPFRALVVMLAKAMKRALYVMCLVFFIMFIFAVAGVLYFGEQATGVVEHWGDLAFALLTIFGLITLDSWVDLLRKVDSLGVAYSRLFPIIFILVGDFVFFNMFVGLVIMEVERMMKDREEVLREQEAAQKRRKQKRTMKQLIGSQVSKLKKWSDTNVRADENFPQIIQQLRMSLSDSDYVVTKDKSSSLTFLQIYLTTLRHQDTTLDRLQQIYEEMLEVLSELLELQQEDQREEKDDRAAPPQPPQRRLSLRLNRELQRDGAPPSQTSRLLRQKIIHLQKVKAQVEIEKTKCSFLEDEVKELQAAKAFLQSQLTTLEKGQSSSSAVPSSIKISSDSESTWSFNFSLLSDEEAKPQVKKESSHFDSGWMRMKTMAGVISRYKRP
ncbi:hypothetical protein SRHO_G00203820 [Serrasalmus rhombeus]